MRRSRRKEECLPPSMVVDEASQGTSGLHCRNNLRGPRSQGPLIISHNYELGRCVPFSAAFPGPDARKALVVPWDSHSEVASRLHYMLLC